MANFNRVILAGNLTRDPEVSYLPSGKAVAKLGLAISRKYTTAEKELKEEVCFVNIVVWGKQAETCGQYLAKGRSVLIEGRLQYDEWEKDGQKRSALKVVADRVQFLGGAPGKSGEFRGGTDEGAGASRKTAAVRAKSEEPVQEEAPVEEAPPAAAAGDEDNLPF